MVDHKLYFDFLFASLEKEGLLPDGSSTIKWRRDFQKHYDLLEFEPYISSLLLKEYGLGFENVILVNCKKNILLSEAFGEKPNQKSNQKLLKTAVYFSLLGCVLDFLLDNGSSVQKMEAREKLGWEYCKEYLVGFACAKSKSAVDIIYEKLAIGFSELKHINPQRYACLLELVKEAIGAELYVADAKQPDTDEALVRNKSVLFVQIAAEIALAGKLELSPVERDAIMCIGKIFALMDDVCDYYEDLEKKQKNMIAARISQGNWEGVLRQAIEELVANLDVLRASVNEVLFAFIKEEVRDWTMSCPELRERIWSYHGKYNGDKAVQLEL